MPDLDTTLADGEAGHTLGHIDERTEINQLRARVSSLEAQISSISTTLEQKFTMPSGGLTESHVSAVLLGTLVRTDGTVLRDVAMTQVAYDALTTKVPTTGYDIVG